MNIVRRFGLGIAAVGWTASASAQVAPAPAPSGQPIAYDTYHGVRVADPQRWLENGDDPAVKAWVATQNARTRAYLDAKADRGAIAAELLRLENSFSTTDARVQVAGGQLFALTFYPKAQQPVLSTLALSGDPATRRAVLDIGRLSADGSVALDWYVPSFDGRLVAVSLSKGGSEIGTLHVYEVATGREIDTPIVDVQRPGGGGSLAWSADGKGFWYTRYPGESAPKEDRDFLQRAFYHRLGTDPASDRAVLATGDGLPRTAEIKLSNQHGADRALASVQLGDGGEWQHYLLTPTGAVRVAGYEAKIKTAVVARDGTVYGVSVAGAPNGKVVRIAPGAAVPAVIVPAGKDALVTEEFAVSGGRLFALVIDGGPTRIVSYALDGSDARPVETPPVSGASEMQAMPGGDLLYRVRRYTEPSQAMLWQAATRHSVGTPIKGVSPMDFSAFEVTRLFATSKDGTRVPITLVARRGLVKDGRTPTILYGYGGYGLSETPGYLQPSTYLWLKAGGAYAVANIRGGGEYGDAWHTGGMLTHKQNVFDDFAAAADYLKAQGVTSTERLALMGGSNGGLLMGATLTQHPGIAHAVVSSVGIYDMLRVELAPNGSFNVSEFGTVKDPDQFRALYAYSPLHHVRAGVQYPALFMATGDNDGRVNPLHSRKFAAALQASGSRAPVFLRTSANAGHGMGSSLDEYVALQADETTFLFDQFGLRWPQPG